MRGRTAAAILAASAKVPQSGTLALSSVWHLALWHSALFGTWHFGTQLCLALGTLALSSVWHLALWHSSLFFPVLVPPLERRWIDHIREAVAIAVFQILQVEAVGMPHIGEGKGDDVFAENV